MMVMVLQKYDIVGIKQMQMAGCDKDKGLPLPRVSRRRWSNQTNCFDYCPNCLSLSTGGKQSGNNMILGGEPFAADGHRVCFGIFHTMEQHIYWINLTVRTNSF